MLQQYRIPACPRTAEIAACLNLQVQHLRSLRTFASRTRHNLRSLSCIVTLAHIETPLHTLAPYQHLYSTAANTKYTAYVGYKLTTKMHN